MIFDFDEWIKRVFRRGAPPANDPASHNHSIAPLEMSDASEAQLINFARDYNGRLREAAVRELVRFTTDGAFQAIVERLNDWVPQVRNAAQKSLESFISPDCVALILRSLRGIMALYGRGRTNHSPYLLRFAEILRTPAARVQVLRHVLACSGKEARYLLDLLTADGEMGEECLQIFVRHLDCVVRLKVVRLCSAQPDHHRAILEQLRQDGHPRVRREVLSIQWSLCDEVARESLLRWALLDRAGSVRGIAVWYARKSNFDLHTFAEQTLTENPLENSARVSRLWLLTNLKMQAGFDLACSELESDCASVRSAALTCLVALNRDAADIYVARALIDPSNKVARLARLVIFRGQVALTHAQFIEAIRTLSSSGAEGRAISTCLLMSIWGRLEGLLISLQESRSAETVQLVKTELLRWERKQGCSAIRLDAVERTRLQVLLDDRRLHDVLSNERSLVFALQTNGLWGD